MRILAEEQRRNDWFSFFLFLWFSSIVTQDVSIPSLKQLFLMAQGHQFQILKSFCLSFSINCSLFSPAFSVMTKSSPQPYNKLPYIIWALQIFCYFMCPWVFTLSFSWLPKRHRTQHMLARVQLLWIQDVNNHIEAENEQP